jgi:T5SS/PEP-CTERM-associated repeat protein
LQWAAGNTADISARLYFALTGDSSATFDTNGNNVIFASNFINKNSLIKEGLGNLTLTGTHSGGIKIKHGALTIGATGAVSAGSSYVGDTNGDVGALQFSGGSLSSGAGILGNAAGSQGTATVTSGSWTNSGNLFVGFSGAGTLLINGGTVSNTIGYIGYWSGSEGSATVTSGSWTNSNDLYVGDRGTGSLLVDGGLVNGSLASTAVNVQSGGFGGIGGLGGNLTLASGTTLVLGVAATAINGPVVAGTSTLSGSITVSPVRSGGTLVPGTYTVLAFSGSLLGSPAFTWSDPAGQLRATSFTTTANEVQVTLETDPQAALNAWRQLHFGSIDNTGDGADLNDFDHDGLVNLVEFAFGLDPTQNSAGQLPEAQRIGGNLITTFSTPAGVSGIIYGAESSTTLHAGDWQRVPDTGSAPEHLFSTPISGDRKFLRLTVVPSPL